jgi:hypothetical protein
MVASPAIAEAERRWLRVLGTLNEYQARLFVAHRALELGRGGISRLSQLTGMSRPTITKGIAVLRGRAPLAAADTGRIRRPGSGRRKVEVVEPAIRRHLGRILEETTAGDPMSFLRWTNKSTRAIAEELTRLGCPITPTTVARCLHDLGYSLQANVKTIEGRQHPDRDAQFRYINARVQVFQRTGDPAVSVDTKKKELIGAFRNAGRTWRPEGAPHRVFTHDFPHLGAGKAIPYGTYDLTQDQAVVNVGVTHDTAEFAVESIRRWWRLMGKRSYPAARRLLVCADAGGSNGNRLRAWKVHLQRLATEVRFPITICHYPPGTSKWTAIEHRLCSFISMNWKGQPLVSYEAVVNLIGHTRTRSGLKVRAVLDTHEYSTGQEVTHTQMNALHLKGHAFHPDWNYTLSPHITPSST